MDRRQLAVLFYDMVDSSALSLALDAEDFAGVLGAFHRHVADIVARHGGFAPRPTGDGGMSYFGYPHAAETDAEQAVRCGLAILAGLPALSDTLGRPMHARVGISAGVALTGDVMGLGPDVAGAAPNLAARLQTLAERDTLLIDAGLHRLVAPLFDCVPLGAQAVRGWDGPVEVWRVLGPAAVEGRFEARTRHGRARLIGRHAEAARLRALWDEACGGRGRAVLLRGEAGIGKSRLVAQLLDDTHATPHRRYRLHCSPHQQGTALYPSIEDMERRYGFAPDDDLAAKREKIAAKLPDMPPDDLALIGGLLMLPSPGGPAGSHPLAQKTRDGTLNALIGALFRASQGQPLLIVLEDAHWADPSTLELGERLVGRIAGAPMLLLVTGRPEFAPAWATADQTIALEPLSQSGSAELARHTVASLGGTALPDASVADIVARCDGNPLFIEEVARGVAEAGGAEAREVPASLQASLLGRLDRLGPAREVARIASVIGRAFDRPMLAAVSGLGGPALDVMIERLLASGLAQRDPDEAGVLRFKHALIQDAAYDSITRGRRRELHARTAGAILAVMPNLGETQPQVLAHHYTEAGERDPATRWWLRAAQQSLHRAAAAEAATMMERALQLVPGLPKGAARDAVELEMQLVLGKAHMASLGQSSTPAGRALARARVLCGAAPEHTACLPVLFGLWSHALMRGEIASARAQAAEIGAIAQTRDDRLWTVTWRYTMGYTRFVAGDFAGAADDLRAGLALYEPSQSERYTGTIIGNPGVLMRIYLSWSLLFLGDEEAALRLAEQALAEGRALGPIWTLVHALSHRGHVAAEIQDPAAAIGYWLEAQPLAAEAGIAYWQATLDLQLGWAKGVVASPLGNPVAGLAQMMAGFARYGSSETSLYTPAFGRWKAELHLGTGDVARAEACLARAYAVAVRRGETWDLAAMLTLRGRILLARDDREGAREALRAAIHTARAQRATVFENRATRLLGTILPAPPATAFAWPTVRPRHPDVVAAAPLAAD